MFLTIAVSVLTFTLFNSPVTNTPNNGGESLVKNVIELPIEHDQMDQTITVVSPVSAPIAAVNAEKILKAPEIHVPAQQELDKWFSEYASQFSVDKNMLQKIAYCESGFNANARSGPYGGMFQYLGSTWSATRSAMGLDPNPDLRFNAEESIRTSAFKIANGGLSSWPQCSKI